VSLRSGRTDFGCKTGWGAFKLTTGSSCGAFNLIPYDHELGPISCGDAQARQHGGGPAVWDPSALDVAQGNPLPSGGIQLSRFQRGCRTGDDLYTDSVVASSHRGQAAVVPPVHSERHARFRDLSQVSPLFYCKIGPANHAILMAIQRERRSSAR